MSLKRKYHNINPFWISLIVAFIFCLMHYALYRWAFITGKGVLTIATLFSLFVIGTLRNNLILGAGHIGYSWALHFSWTVIMFSCEHFQIGRSEELSEVSRFNLFLGNQLTITVLSILALLSLILIKIKTKAESP